jgi:hypothetical protein
MPLFILELIQILALGNTLQSRQDHQVVVL